MAAERATAAKVVLPFQNVQEQGLPLQIKMDEGNKQGGRLKGTHIIQAGNLTNILGWMGSEQTKQEPDEELPQCWDHLKLVPVLFEDMDVQSPEAEHALLDRRQQLLREAQAGLEREASSLVDSSAVVSKAQNIFEEPEGTPQLTVGGYPIVVVPVAEEADPLPNPVSPAPQSIPGSPDTVSSTADVHVSPPHSPLPGPTGLSAAERLANLRSRHKKTRNDLALDLAKAADRRMQLATDKILLALEDYAKADQEDREKHRVGTEQIIAIMNRQTELLELLVRQQSPVPVAGSSRHAWSPRVGQASLRPAGSSSFRFGISRRLLMARARNRRRPQNLSS
ncbi:hypothetical protein JD844_013770 [Phrynosoma platyrhinos]|uniref:Uncharacterized protein n=1 Tax=Phrynosoma platyrhinos TaxID=52577 RepID=A0ABQ7TL74_PHRPL|nr:hypothetical protein JD844_013770 [Phrynosoma platyrhinos]